MKTNIKQKQPTMQALIDQLQAGGYVVINGIRLYVSSTEPTGDIPDGSIGVGW